MNEQPGIVVAVGNQKGGVGKTTMTINMAAALQASGNRVAVVDADPQNTSLRMLTSSETASPFFVTSVAGAKNCSATLRDLKQNYDVVIVDCPGGLTDPIIPSIWMEASFCLIPFGPSPTDLLSTAKMVAEITQFQSMRNPGLRAALVLNSKNGKTRVLEDVLSNIPGITDGTSIRLLETHIAQREIYRQVSLVGTTIFHCPSTLNGQRMKGLKEAKAEIYALVAEIIEYCNETVEA